MTGHDIHQTTLGNGLTVLVETMPSVKSAAFSLLIPAGSAYDPLGQNGTANAMISGSPIFIVDLTADMSPLLLLLRTPAWLF